MRIKNNIQKRCIINNKGIITDNKIIKNYLHTNEKKANIKILEKPIKGKNDRKKYRIIKLENNLTALLISDYYLYHNNNNNMNDINDDNKKLSSSQCIEEIGIAACGVCVDVGSFNDPRDIQGLSHFLEHMIFMGSKKYPNENEFDAYIKKCGGYDNADTDAEETSFYFEIPMKCLDGALDRFSNLLSNPIMSKDSMKREREAVESEFLAKRQGEYVRRQELLSSMANPNHPASIFGWGNLKTLKENISDDDLHKRLHEFYNTHYKSNSMYLCVQANLPLDILQSKIQKYFHTIPCQTDNNHNNSNNNITFQKYGNMKFTPTDTFLTKFAYKIFYVKPIVNINKIDITWCMSSLLKDYKCKSHRFIAYLLGYEGAGSLSSYLREKLWAFELVCGIDENGFGFNSLYSLFTITVFVTKQGLQHITEIFNAIFSYIDFLQCSDLNAIKSIFYELQHIEKLIFENQFERDPLENVEEYIGNLKCFPASDVLIGATLYLEYNEKAIINALNELNTKNFNVMLTITEPLYDKIKYNKTEKWMGTEYSELIYPLEWKQSWNILNKYDEFHLPRKNEFITNNFTIINSEINNSYNRNKFEFPKKIISNKICELWFKDDKKFLTPTGRLHFHIQSAIGQLNPSNIVMKYLYAFILKYHLVENLYPATIANLSYDCLATEKGLSFQISGYNEHLHKIIETITKCCTELSNKITEKEFNIFVEQQSNIYYNTFIDVKTLAKDLRLTIIETKHCSALNKHTSLQNIKFKDFKLYLDNFLRELKIQILIQGNFEKSEALSIAENVMTTLKPKEIKNLNNVATIPHKLPNGTSYAHCRTFNLYDVNTIVSNYYQILPITLENACFIDLLMIIAAQPLFDIIRTKEQLCYDVSCNFRDNNGAIGYTIVVNSQENRFSAKYVDERIENFRIELLTIIQNISINDFQQYKETLINSKMISDTEIKDEVNRNWTEIVAENYLFHRFLIQIYCIQHISYEKFLQFYKEHLKLENQRKLSVQIIGETDINANVETINKSKVLYNKYRMVNFNELQQIKFEHLNGGHTIKSIKHFKSDLEPIIFRKMPITKL